MGEHGQLNPPLCGGCPGGTSVGTSALHPGNLLGPCAHKSTSSTQASCRDHMSTGDAGVWVIFVRSVEAASRS